MNSAKFCTRITIFQVEIQKNAGIQYSIITCYVVISVWEF